MIIHVYTMCYNEEILMPYFLRHYGSFADRIFVFDHYSTDKTVQIVNSHQKTTCVSYGIKDEADNTVLVNLKNEAYKVSRGKADWVMIVDVDEFVYYPNLVKLLKSYKERGITLPKTRGCDMIADGVPTHPGQIYEVIQKGVPDIMFSKRAVFNPSIDIRYFPGAHKCNPQGNVVESEESEIKILHYRFLSAEFTADRVETRTTRRSQNDIENQWGIVKVSSGKTLRETVMREYAERKAIRIPLV